MRARPLLISAGFILALLLGYFLARSAAPRASAGRETQAAAAKPSPPHDGIELDPVFRTSERPAFKSDREALAAGALVGQRSLVFKDRAALDAFLAKAGNRIRILGRIDQINALRVAFLNLDDLNDLLDGSEKMAMIFPAFMPENESVPAQAGAVPMGAGLLGWLGISGDNSQAGQGVKIAYLDTGVDQHSSFGGKVIQMSGSGDVNGHGTAGASMIEGNTGLIPGVAPASTILSYQIGDAEGNSDGFKLAQAIFAAIDAGVNIINISFGSSSQSDILSQAVAKAIEAGIMVVAATGNSGLDHVFYPAGDKGVIAVGAVDRTGQLLAFSNTGDAVSVATPGYGLNAAWLDDGAVSVSGTSFSAPIIAGMISATMTGTGKNLTAQQAWALILANLNDAGAPGYDPQYGYGLPDMSRVRNASTPGIYDAAVASQWVATSKGNTELQVTIQNRGTETLINTGLLVTTPAGTSRFNATTLKAGAIQTFALPISLTGDAMEFQSTVSIYGGQADSKPSNNNRIETYTPAK